MALNPPRQDALNPINPTKAESLLGKYAASDAKHDFATSFISIFNGREYKDIGTTGKKPDGYFDEWGSFSNIFRHDPSDKTDKDYIFKGTGTAGDLFKANVLRTDRIFASNGLSGIHLNADLDATHTYTLKTRLFESRERGFQMKSAELLTFLGDNDVYIQQDASFISFSDFFINLSNNGPGSGRQTFNYLSSREGQNDAAGKTSSDSAVIKKTMNNTVKVTLVEEDPTNNENKIYPKFDTNIHSDVYQNFQSIYNLSLSPIKTVKNVKMVSLDFYDKDIINSTQKGKAENAKGNLKSRLINFFSNFTGARNNNSYFTALQQKRSGDWLQVLSTFDLQRYNRTDMKQKRAILITHDLICGSYAIAMGANVLLTIQKGNDKWLVYFQNDRYLLSPTRGTLYTRYSTIKEHIPRDILDNIDAYVKQRSPILVSKDAEAKSINLDSFTISGTSIKDFHDDTVKFIQNLLEQYFKLAIALSIFPDGKVYRDSYTQLSKALPTLEPTLEEWRESNENLKTDDKDVLVQYENIVNELYKLNELLNQFRDKGGAGGIEVINLSLLLNKRFSTKSKDIQELNKFLGSFTPFSLEDTSNPEGSKTYLNRFRFTTDQNKKNKNDYGVFAIYINKLNDTTKKELYTKLRGCNKKFHELVDRSKLDRGKEKLEALKNQFDLFLSEITCYFSDGGKVNPPTYEAATTGELLHELNEIQEIPKDTPEMIKAAGPLIEDAKSDRVFGNLEGGVVTKRGKKLPTNTVSVNTNVDNHNDSLINSTPFSIYLIWLLQKREMEILKKKAYTVKIIGALTAASGLYLLKGFFGSLLTDYTPPNIAENILLSITGVATMAVAIPNSIMIPIIQTISSIEPIKLTTDAYITLSNDSYLSKLKTVEQTLKRNTQSKALNKRGLGGAVGGGFHTIDLPFQGWSSLFFHMDTLRSQLDDIQNPELTFDLSSFARYAQFLLAIEKSIDPSIAFFTQKRATRGGQYGSTTVVLTDDSEIQSRPVHLVLRLKGEEKTNDLYHLPLSYCALFTSFGEYCDLILTNLLPRIYFDEVWNEAKPMLTKAFTGSEESETKGMGIIAEICNENYLNAAADRSLDPYFQENDLFLRYFLITICYTLEQMSPIDLSLKSKESLEQQLNQSIQRLIRKINVVEKNMLLYMYKRKSMDHSISFENMDDMEFLMEKNLLNKDLLTAEGGRRRVGTLKKRTYGKTKKNGRKMRLKSRRKS